MAKKKKTTKKVKKKTATPAKPVEPVTQPKIEQPVNPAFEQTAAGNVTEPEKKDNRGGARPGAGRPAGLTDEKAKVKNLPQFPSIPIRQGCQALFDMWSAAAKIEQLALSDDEADLLSLPLTQLQEYYFPGILPEIAGTWIMLIFAVTRVVKPRIDIVNTVRRDRRAAKTAGPKKEPGPDEIIVHYLHSGAALHKIDPDSWNDYTSDPKKATCPECLRLLSKGGLN